MVELQSSKLATRVRFPSPAPLIKPGAGYGRGSCILSAEGYYRSSAKMKAKIALLLFGLSLPALPTAAQQPLIGYTLMVNTNDCSSVLVTIRLRNLPAHFHMATVRHFLADDRPWRYVEDLRLTPGTMAQEQDGLWRVTGASPD